MKALIKKFLLRILPKPLIMVLREWLFVLRQGTKMIPIRKFIHIDGWLTPAEAFAIYALVSEQKKPHQTVVEIGSWLGKSSYVIARAMGSLEGSRLHCIDPFDGKGGESEQGHYDVLKEKIKAQSGSLQETFIQNMRSLGVFARIKVLPGYSHDYHEAFTAEIDILFIDGNHEYEAVLQDYRQWSPKVKVGGFILFHDVNFHPSEVPHGDESFLGPAMVVKEEVFENACWKEIALVESLYVAEKMC